MKHLQKNCKDEPVSITILEKSWLATLYSTRVTQNRLGKAHNKALPRRCDLTSSMVKHSKNINLTKIYTKNLGPPFS